MNKQIMYEKRDNEYKKEKMTMYKKLKKYML